VPYHLSSIRLQSEEKRGDPLQYRFKKEILHADAASLAFIMRLTWAAKNNQCRSLSIEIYPPPIELLMIDYVL